VKPELHQVICEVRYDRGFKYFDRCGSLLLSLADVVGEGFEASVPTMQFGRLASVTENVDVRYTQAGCSVTHVNPATAARVIQLAPRCWRAVAEALDVKRRVVRLGSRIYWFWPARSAVARDRMMRAATISPSPDAAPWKTIMPSFGEPRHEQVVCRAETADGRMVRATWSAVEMQKPTERTPSVPGVLFDVDFIAPNEGSATEWGHDDVAAFLKHAWRDALAASQQISERLKDAGFEESAAGTDRSADPAN
jgi:hypothetical protein